MAKGQNLLQLRSKMKLLHILLEIIKRVAPILKSSPPKGQDEPIVPKNPPMIEDANDILDDIKEEVEDIDVEFREPLSNNPPASVVAPRFLWILDAGHGELTAGKRSPVFPDTKERLFEYKFNRQVVDALASMLNDTNIEYVILVPETKVGNFLRERTTRANNFSNKLPSLLVSVHGNAGPTAYADGWVSPEVSGIEVWHYSKSIVGKKLAAIFQRHIVKHTGRKNRGIKSRKENEFYILKHTRMPAILTENGFYNNFVEASKMRTPEYVKAVATAHFEAIKEVEANGIS